MTQRDTGDECGCQGCRGGVSVTIRGRRQDLDRDEALTLAGDLIMALVEAPAVQPEERVR